jgi:hypothetical protein
MDFISTLVRGNSWLFAVAPYDSPAKIMLGAMCVKMLQQADAQSEIARSCKLADDTGERLLKL